MGFIVLFIASIGVLNLMMMAVFERTREMSVLAALGMKGRQIMGMLLFESAILALVGIFFGLIMGIALVVYTSQVGIPIGEAASASAGSFTIGASIYTKLDLTKVAQLSSWMLGIILLVSLYPAWYAARLEPVEALQAL